MVRSRKRESSRAKTPGSKKKKKKASAKATSRKSGSKKRATKTTTKKASRKTGKKVATKKAARKPAAKKKKMTGKTSAGKKAAGKKATRKRGTTAASRGASVPAGKVARRTAGSTKAPSRAPGASSSCGGRRGPRSRARAAARDPWRVVKIGFHLGNCRTVVAASKEGEPLELGKDIFPNVVGFLRFDARSLPSYSADTLDVVFAEEAFRNRRQLDFRRPIRSGAVVDVKVCRQFAAHITATVNPRGGDRLWGVISAPAGATGAQWEANRRGMGAVLERAVVASEPRLIAEGMHLETAGRAQSLGDELSRGSLVIDIGSVATDITVIRGDSVDDDEHVSLDRGSDSIDDAILGSALTRYPGLGFTRRSAREIKEEQAFVSGMDGRGAGPTYMSSELLALTEVMRRSCDELFRGVVEATLQLLERQDAGTLARVTRNIILTGGGSHIRHFPARLAERLREGGHPDARVLVPQEFKHLVARGALRLAERLGDDDWEELADFRPSGVAAASELPSLRRSASTELSGRSPSPRPPQPLADVPVPAVRAAAGSDGGEEARRDFALEDLEELELFRGL